MEAQQHIIASLFLADQIVGARRHVLDTVPVLHGETGDRAPAEIYCKPQRNDHSNTVPFKASEPRRTTVQAFPHRLRLPFPLFFDSRFVQCAFKPRANEPPGLDINSDIVDGNYSKFVCYRNPDVDTNYLTTPGTYLGTCKPDRIGKVLLSYSILPEQMVITDDIIYRIANLLQTSAPHPASLFSFLVRMVRRNPEDRVAVRQLHGCTWYQGTIRDRDDRKKSDNKCIWTKSLSDHLGAPFEELEKLRGKFGNISVKQKMETLNYWQMKSKDFDHWTLIEMTEDFVGRGIDQSVLTTTDTRKILKAIVRMIPRRLWMRFVRLCMRLSKDEIMSLHQQYAEFNQEQKYEILKNWLTFGKLPAGQSKRDCKTILGI